MKCSSYFLIVFTLLFQPTGAIIAQDIKAPSDFRKTSQKIPTAKFLVFELSDFRLVFSTQSVLDDRIARSVCVLDEYVGFKEVVISGAISLADFMKIHRPELSEKWQIRLIKKDLIAQTPMPNDLESFKRFFALPVEPGDIVIITVHQENPSDEAQILDPISNMSQP